MSPRHATTYLEVPDATDALLLPKSPCTRKSLTTADTLSRAPFHRNLTRDEKLLSEDLNLYVSMPANYRAPLSRNTPSSG